MKPEREPTKNFWDEKFVNRDDYLEATRNCIAWVSMTSRFTVLRSHGLL